MYRFSNQQRSLRRSKKRSTLHCSTHAGTSESTAGVIGGAIGVNKGIERSVLDQVEVAKSSSKLFLYNSEEAESESSSTPASATGSHVGGPASNVSSKTSTNQQNRLLRAGTIDALIVLATQSYKNDFLYQEAFLCTYRTFVSTHDLLEKLVHRFRRFSSSSKKKLYLKVAPPRHAIDASDDEGTAAALQLQYQKVARSSFSLLVS